MGATEGNALRTARTARNSEERYRRAFDAAGVPLCEGDCREVAALLGRLRAEGVTDLRSHLRQRPPLVRKAVELMRVTDVNREAVRAFDASSKAELIASFGSTFTDSSFTVFSEALGALWEGQESFSADAELRTLAGERRQFRVIATSPGDSGDLDSIVITLVNATESGNSAGSTADDRLRTQAEAALRRTEKKLSRIFETNLLGLLYFDLDGSVEDANDEFLRIVGYDHDDLHGGRIDWLRMTPREFKRKATRAVGELLRSGVHAPVEKQYIRKDGSRVWVLVGSALIEGESGVGFVLDLTNLKAADAALREADRRKDEFLATLAHELRNPLAPIRTAVHLLGADPAAQEARLAREIIERQVQHMVRLVDDLLDVSRITLGLVTLQHEQLTLGRLVTDALDGVGSIVEESGHRLEVHLPAEPLRLDGDAIRLSQVLQNLLNNACKYTPRGGRITLRAERVGEDAVVAIRDTGVGIPKEMQKRVFELFTRIHPRDRIKSSGLGIGLALSKRLVELHGGHIELDSEGAGHGSEFRVYLPLVERADASATETAVPSMPHAGSADARRILVVDDNADAAESLAMLLAPAGNSVAKAFDGTQALAALESFSPEVVLLDIGMPGLDGYEVARRMRASPRGKNVLLVALTGWGQAEDKRRALEAGFDLHLTKPVDPARLDTLLRQHVRAEPRQKRSRHS